MKDRILAIAELTFRKIKEPAFSLLFIFAAIIGYCVSEMEPLSFQKENAILSELIFPGGGAPVLTSFLFVIFMSLLIGIFSGATDIPRDIESRMIMIFVGKPIKRVEYLLGKYLGVCCICIAFFAIASLAISAGHLIKTGEFHSLQSIARQMFLALSIFPFVAMTMMFSCFLPDLSAIIVTVVYIMFAVFLATVPLFVEVLPKSINITSYLYFFYYLFPNFFYYFQSFKILGLVTFSLIIYSISLTIIFLMIASAKLNTRDMI